MSGPTSGPSGPTSQASGRPSRPKVEEQGREPSTTERPGVDVASVRESIAGRPLRPYEILFDTDRWSPETLRRAERILDEGWRVAGGRVELGPPIAWDEVLAHDRSAHFHLHSWYPLGTVLSAFDRTEEARFLRFALDVALDWVRRHRAIDGTSPFAWYDMAVGLRALRLGYLIDAVARTPWVSDTVLGELLGAALLHRDALSDDGLFPAHSNHGFYFAAGQAALAARLPELPRMEEARRQAQERLAHMVRAHFTAEGVHREHSPKYHWLLLDTIQGLRTAGILEGEEYAGLCAKLQDALAWFVLPNGRLAMFGDTDHRLMVGLEWPHPQTDALRFVFTGGREGAPPAERMRAFPASGYVVCRDGWPRGPDDFDRWAYLAQACAFHSRTHKHADDLSFIWYDRGQEILVDAGGFGYAGKTEPGSELWKDGFWYADPNRIYVESTRSHNTVQIDGRNLPRRGVEPYGSALVRWGSRDEVHFVESEACYWDTISHRRILLFRPSRWLIVLDRLFDEESLPHEFLQRFHFAPELAVEPEGEGGLRIALAGEEESLHVVSLVEADLLGPVRGQGEPERLGWISRKDGEMIPCSSSGFGVSGRSAHTFATLFSFGEEAPRPVATPGPGGPDQGGLGVAWAQDRRTHAVALQRPEGKGFALRYRVDDARGRGADR